MSEYTHHGVRIECTQGDITRQADLDAIVNAANAQLRTGGGVAGAIHRAAGPDLVAECEPLAPIRPGDAVITGAHDLPNAHVIHCLGPVYGIDQPSDELLARAYERALTLADQEGLRSIGFPALSTGAFGYPMEEAAEVAFGAVTRACDRLRSVKVVRFVLFSDSDRALHEQVLKRLIGSVD
ncbi:O-acetyl-ADP-ribose deacetylase (regulator of RNase III) [Tamilnaduibacter salinus]|uniref:O-acetyl-ADP-ribose deacetylase (Regulator of RNase III) n=1 Tax=Tamilnaduibacter salinus TaxID=1484056 RepID=A0A2U1CYG9_9GAMM|nr:macro domain-containing protein [Tamilnaduibacter salinus]PVY77538.1 O-acetyl-ADP-ribose deacetylase (regulator of RNase III) [Tamilnaduibacter salinus]